MQCGHIRTSVAALLWEALSRMKKFYSSTQAMNDGLKGYTGMRLDCRQDLADIIHHALVAAAVAVLNVLMKR